MQVFAIIKLLTSFFAALPVFERLFKALAQAIQEGMAVYYAKKLEKDLTEAKKKAKETGDTSDLEKLLGKK